MERSNLSPWPGLLLACTLVVPTLSGCASQFRERQLIPPTDPGAQTCMAQCEFNKAQCEQRQHGREEECRTHHDRLTADLNACRATPGALCPQPEICLGADLVICETRYDECVVACGGRVETRFSLTGESAP
ncbi:MAG: hypothetical protein LJE61_02105 [Thiocapsa sp.]|nr:hypothetical protein [Thiocapsa sp.]MCG6983981.1 hypothetical protein [Thiocapsa sp.]